METVYVFIETQLDTRTSFGARVDNGEGVFINARLVKKHDLKEEETYRMVVLPNVGDENSATPWKAITMSMEETLKGETPRVVVAKLEDRITAHFEMEENQFAHTAKNLAKALSVGDGEMQQVLHRMHNAGEIAKAQVWAKGGQDRASTVLWAPATDWFAT